jgi:hypothetical protein
MEPKISEATLLALKSSPESTINTLYEDGTLFKVVELDLYHPIRALWDSGILKTLIKLDEQNGNIRNQLILYLLNLIRNLKPDSFASTHDFIEILPGKAIKHIVVASPNTTDSVEIWLQQEFTPTAPLIIQINGKVEFQDSSPVWKNIEV